MTASCTGQRLYQKSRGYIPGGTHLLSKRPEMFLPGEWPCYYRRAEGCQLWDLDGRRYVDMSINGVGACVLGYADPDVNGAVVSAVEAGSMATLNCPEEVELAELLCELHPWAEMVRYARTGGEIMAVAVRIARARTGRSKVVFCGYHGWSDWYLAANLAEADVLGTKRLLLSGLEPAGVPVELSGTALTFRHNHLEELQEAIRQHAAEIAAVVCEPQRHERPTAEFLEGVRKVASEIGAVLIFDEISSGFRLNTGGVHLLYGVTPDLAVFAKALSNGFPMAAVIGTADVMQAAQDTFISSTYWTERIGPAAAVASIRKHNQTKTAERLIAVGRRIQRAWAEAAEAAGLDVAVGHPDMPPLSYLHFNYANDRAMQTLLCQMMLDRGFLDNGSLYATYAHTDDVLDEYVGAVKEVFVLLADSQRTGQVERQLRGPIAHRGFVRLTR